jgi:hypothetical protein
MAIPDPNQHVEKRSAGEVIIVASAAVTGLNQFLDVPEKLRRLRQAPETPDPNTGQPPTK